MLIAIGVVAGCGSGRPDLVPVSGKVLYKGAPLGFGSVVFQPENGRSAIGKIQPDGTFTLGTYSASDGARPGRHRVTVSCYDGQQPGRESAGDGLALGKPLVPVRYANADTSGIEIVIEDDGSDSVVIELRG